MWKLRPIKPKVRAGGDFARAEKAVRDAMAEARDGALKDFNSTTASWEHNVSFTAEMTREGYIISTDDKVWNMLEEGTPPHVIVAHGKALAFSPGGSPKTQPGVIGSGPGSRGDTRIFRKMVNHPGTDPRDWIEVIGKKWDTELPQLILNALDILGRD